MAKLYSEYLASQNLQVQKIIDLITTCGLRGSVCLKNLGDKKYERM